MRLAIDNTLFPWRRILPTLPECNANFRHRDQFALFCTTQDESSLCAAIALMVLFCFINMQKPLKALLIFTMYMKSKRKNVKVYIVNAVINTHLTSD